MKPYCILRIRFHSPNSAVSNLFCKFRSVPDDNSWSGFALQAGCLCLHHFSLLNCEAAIAKTRDRFLSESSIDLQCSNHLIIGIILFYSPDERQDLLDRISSKGPDRIRNKVRYSLDKTKLVMGTLKPYDPLKGSSKTETKVCGCKRETAYDFVTL